MKEARGNLWTFKADIRVITTNGAVRKDGECVMGRGCAFEAKSRYPGVAKMLGALIREHGNHVHLIFRGNPLTFQTPLVSFPVKHHWAEMADPKLIERSAHELVALADDQAWIDGWQHIVLPRPGCGNGSLRWDDVKPILDPILDERFTVITF